MVEVRALFAALLLMVLAVSSIVPTVTGSPPSPNLSMTVGPETVSVAISLSIQQNLTAFDSTFSLPQVHGVLEGPTATNATLALQSAIASKTSHAKVERLRLEAQTSAWSNTTKVQWLNITVNFDVNGISTTGNGVSRVDLSWKSFSLTSDLTLNGFEVNNIGVGDLRPIAHELAQEKGTQFVSFSYRVNNIGISQGFFADQVATLHAMNFSRLGKPVAQWNQGYVPLAPTTVRTFTPPNSLLGLSFFRTVSVEPTTPTTDVFGLFYTVQGQVTVPASSFVSGDTVTVSTSGFPETLMGMTIISSIVIGSGAYLYEKRLSPSKGAAYSGRKRTKR